MAEKKEFSTYLANANTTYMGMIERQMEGNRIDFSEYSKRCVINAIGAINSLLDTQCLTFNDIDQSNLTNILLNIAHLELNAVAQPSECYFQIRNVKTKNKDERGNDIYKKQIEFGIQGDGYDALLSRFGRGVKKVYPHWIVREGDYFKYPKYQGLSYSPPEWEPSGNGGEVVRIVYPVLHNDDTIHFYIGEREEVVKNLLAHINNNMMNETFGICKNRYSATPDQLTKINEKKAALKAKAKKLGFEALEDEELAPFISPSWKEDFSKESMIIRKIRNNIVKRIPKDFGHPAVFESYSEASSDGYANTKQIILDNTATSEVATIEALGGTVDTQSGEVKEPIREVEEKPNEAQERNFEPQGADVDNRVKPSFN